MSEPWEFEARLLQKGVPDPLRAHIRDLVYCSYRAWVLCGKPVEWHWRTQAGRWVRELLEHEEALAGRGKKK